jgi:hypothetical protein
VGVPIWAQKDGNHTWVEIWDGDWFFTGADEFDKQGLNRGWFNGDAARTARSTNRLNQIYASSWRLTGDYFPLAWDLDSREVPAVNVSTRYAALAPDSDTTATVVHARLWDKEGGERLLAAVELRRLSGELLATNQTRAGTADPNDMPEFALPDKTKSVVFRFVRGGETREKIVPCAACVRSHTIDCAWADLAPVSARVLAAETWLAKPPSDRGEPPNLSFTRDEAERIVSLAWADLRKSRAASAVAELEAKKIVLGEHSLNWLERTFGEAPDGRHSLWITMHGGGQATEQANDLAWRGYFGSYEFPPGSINAAPRAPANSWNMWHVKWTDGLLDRLIADMCCSVELIRTAFTLSATPRAVMAFINCRRACPIVSRRPLCARDIRMKSFPTACAICRSSFTWAGRTRLTTATA